DLTASEIVPTLPSVAWQLRPSRRIGEFVYAIVRRMTSGRASDTAADDHRFDPPGRPTSPGWHDGRPRLYARAAVRHRVGDARCAHNVPGGSRGRGGRRHIDGFRRGSFRLRV